MDQFVKIFIFRISYLGGLKRKKGCCILKINFTTGVMRVKSFYRKKENKGYTLAEVLIDGGDSHQF